MLTELLNRVAGSNGNGYGALQVFDDDVTLLGLEIEDRGIYAKDIIKPRNIDDFLILLNKVYQKIKSEWEIHGFTSPETRLHRVLEEALVNAWKHGNEQDPVKSITVRRRYGNDAVMEIIDEGKGFNFKTFYDPTFYENRMKFNGRGIFIIRLFTDEVQWKNEGRHIMTFFSKKGEHINNRAAKSWLNIWKPGGKH